MSDTLLNISGKIDTETVALYKRVGDVASQLSIPFVVVGASARDIVLHYGHGARIQRATTDIDFGIQVPNWSAFATLKRGLLDLGFKEARDQHRVVSPGNVQVDIVPFGQIEDKKANIQWPPDGDFIMNVLGFQEACDNAETVRIQNNPPVDIPVATPEGMTILKLIAWTDRTADMRGKDAKDLCYLFTTYEKIPTVSEGLHDSQTLMVKYDWDIVLAGAHQLGINAANIVENKTYEAIACLFKGTHKSLTIELLIEGMCEQIEYEYEHSEILINAFIDGFTNKGDLVNANSININI